MSTHLKELKQYCILQQQNGRANRGHADNYSFESNVPLHAINPCLLSQFTNDSVLGQGTFGTVQIRKLHGYRVAVKTFKPKYSTKEDVTV